MKKIILSFLIFNIYSLSSRSTFENKLIQGSIKELDTKIKLSFNINKKDSYNKTYLMLACEYGAYDLVASLLKRKAKLELHDYRGDTAFLLAVKNKNIEIAKLLKKYGSNINYRNKDNYNALFIAIQNGDIDTVDFLLEEELNPNEKFDSLNALQFALLNVKNEDYYRIVKLLLLYDADINYKTTKNYIIVFDKSDINEEVNFVEFNLKEGYNSLEIAKMLKLTKIAKLLEKI